MNKVFPLFLVQIPEAQAESASEAGCLHLLLHAEPVEQWSPEKACNTKSRGVRCSCPPCSASSGSDWGFKLYNSLCSSYWSFIPSWDSSSGNISKTRSIKSLITERLIYVKSERLLPRLSEMRLVKGTQGWEPIAAGACTGSRRLSYAGFHPPCQGECCSSSPGLHLFRKCILSKRSLCAYIQRKDFFCLKWKQRHRANGPQFLVLNVTALLPHCMILDISFLISPHTDWLTVAGWWGLKQLMLAQRFECQKLLHN